MKVKTSVNVLLVDDERSNLIAFSSILGGLDVNLVYATSGEEALRQALLNEFAVILLDFYMPIMGGLEVAQIIRTRSQTPIIFITASGPGDFPIEEAYSLGAVDYFTKPYNSTVLKSKVAFFIELHKRTEALAASERARYLSELDIKEGRIRLILENAKGYAFIATDIEGRITEWEGDSSVVTGWTAEEAVGQPISLIYTEKDRIAGYPGIELATAKTSGASADKRWYNRQDGRRFYADSVTVPLKDAADQVHGFSKIFRDVTSEQLAYEQLRISLAKLQDNQALFSLLLESSVDGIYGVSPDASCTFVNAAGAAMLGYRPDELVGRPIDSVIHKHPTDPGSYSTKEGRVSKAAREGQSIRVDDDVFLHKDGRAVPVSYSVAPMISDGKPAGAVLTFADVTERRRNELEKEFLMKEIQTSHNQMANVFKQAPAFMCILRGAQHVVEKANDRYMELVGHRKVLNRTMRESLPELESQGFFELLDRVFTTGQSYVGNDVQIGLQRQAGAEIESRFVDFVFIALQNNDGEVNGVLIHGVDQTERKLAELAVQSSEERYRTLFESVDQGFCIVELLLDEKASPINYKIVEMNPAYQRLIGLSVLGDPSNEELRDANKLWLDTYSRVALTGESVRFELQDAADNRWFDIFITPIGSERKNKLAVLWNEVTERKQTEESLRRLAADLAETDRRKSEFLATLAHELRNPLAPIRNGLKILHIGGENLTALAKTREMMERQVNHMVHLVDDLLDISRISGGKIELKKEIVDLKELVASAVETSLPLIESGQHTLTIHIPDDSIMLYVDSIRIAQVISNLLNNAAKYTPAGGHIEVFVGVDEGEVSLFVKDNGIGIPAHALPTIFEMFNQVECNIGHAQGGLGIGLTLVRQIVEMHDGSVNVVSVEGGGSTFTVKLPVAEVDRLSETNHGIVDEIHAHQSLRILIVDDNVDAAHSLSLLLEFGGHTLFVANDGADAIKVAKNCKPHVIFLDIGMPGMNGYEAAAALRKIEGLEETVLVALTGWGAEQDKIQSRNAGFDQHLIKPAQMSAIDSILSTLKPSF